jgi:hypothetical protein
VNLLEAGISRACHGVYWAALGHYRSVGPPLSQVDPEQLSLSQAREVYLELRDKIVQSPDAQTWDASTVLLGPPGGDVCITVEIDMGSHLVRIWRLISAETMKDSP